MKGKRFSAEQIVNKLRQVEVELSQGQALSQITKGLGITGRLTIVSVYSRRTIVGVRSTAVGRQTRRNA